MHADRQTEIAH